ncbi:MAG: aldehyde dehydrogenase (NADP(+)) [Acidobacteria bacterium]|jgi:NADP-dependent aldehyde dehydrogenase|nr:aldehyde dehydrogenase (NADP(+)) [Acidobacteriota bacterium]
MNLTGEQIIGFKFSKKGSATFWGINPANGEALGPHYYEAVDLEIDRAFRMAEQAFKIYRAKKAVEKALFLERIAEEILALGDELIQRCMAETALPEVRLVGERARTVNQLRLFAQVLREGSWVEARIDTAVPDRQPPKPDIRQISIPLGPVGVFGAGNFPFAFSAAGGDTASALAAGCPVVFKAHPGHPGTSEMIARAILKAAQEMQMPEGIFSMVHGLSTAVGMSIVNHPMAKAIGFTGSFKGGKALYDAAVRRSEPIPVYAEMGSTNPVFILPGALRERKEAIAEGLIKSVTLGVGQFCTKPGIIFLIQSPEAEAFIEIAKKEMSDAPVGIMLTDKLKSSFAVGIEARKAIEDLKVIAHGKTWENEMESACRALPFLFRADLETFKAYPLLEEELFGPGAVIVTVPDKKELIKLALSLKGHLTATIHSTVEELSEFSDLVDILENKVGRLILNGFPTGVEVCPSMHHGGPYPATTDLRITSVGTAAIKRFVRPVCFQDFPQALLPEELHNNNPLHIFRLVNGQWTKNAL